MYLDKYEQHESSNKRGFISTRNYKIKFRETCRKNRRKRKKKK